MTGIMIVMVVIFPQPQIINVIAVNVPKIIPHLPSLTGCWLVGAAWADEDVNN